MPGNEGPPVAYWRKIRLEVRGLLEADVEYSAYQHESWGLCPASFDAQKGRV